MKHITYQGLNFRKFIAEADLRSRISEMAREISARYAGKNPLLVCVLTGAAPFAVDLFRALDIDAEIAFIRFKSYEGMASTGEVRQVMGLTEPVDGRDVIIVEDIIDTGRTMKLLKAQFEELGPRSLAVATLLSKPSARKVEVEADWTGFEIPDRFIIGYGLDIDGQARNLNDIYVLDSESSPGNSEA